jgi:uncharacterized protein YbjT (DUF2867 family)
MTKYIVAGATGQVGGFVARAMLERGREIELVIRQRERASTWAERRAQVAIGSLDDVGFMTEVLRGASGFFTLLPAYFGAPDFYAAQRRSADVIAQAVADSGVPHVVLLSSVGAHRADRNGPTKGLHYAERALTATGVKLTALRPFYFQENVARGLELAKKSGIYLNFFTSADAPFPTISTRDIGRIAASALCEPPPKSEVLDLHGPRYSIRDLATKLGEALGKPLAVVDIPPEEHVAVLLKAGMPQAIAEAYAEMLAGVAAGLLTPEGDRTVYGTTTVDEVIPDLLARRAE